MKTREWAITAVVVGVFALLVVMTGQHRRDTIDYLDRCLKNHGRVAGENLVISSDEWFQCVENARDMTLFRGSEE